MTLHVDGAIDMHCHFDEDTVGGHFDPETGQWPPRLDGVPAYEVVKEARDVGHSALVLKSHSFASPALASALTAALPGIEVFSGICTDHLTGGLNVAAVEAALALGAKIVWLPTIHSTHDIAGGNFSGWEGEPVRVVDQDNNLLPAVHEIFDVVQQAGAILATGHISKDEHLAVVREFATRGKVLVTHAGDEVAGPSLTGAECRELADLGAMIEFTALTCNHAGQPSKAPSVLADNIREVGAQRCVLSSDYGWAQFLPKPAVGLKSFFEQMWDCGVPEEDIVMMARKNPARLLER